MRWSSSNIITSMQSLLSGFSTPATENPNLDHSLESIREAMLDALGSAGASKHPVVELRITYANEVQDLWYLRGDVMAVLADTEGEASARQKMNHISNMFQGLLPKFMSSRPSPLSEH
jgi:hypothetical protein